mgnify:CR=1 FL=1
MAIRSRSTTESELHFTNDLKLPEVRDSDPETRPLSAYDYLRSAVPTIISILQTRGGRYTRKVLKVSEAERGRSSGKYLKNCSGIRCVNYS